MNWNNHSKDVPEGSHAFLGASKYHWLNYSDEKIVEAYNNHLAKVRGTELHDLAAKLIKLKTKLPSSRKTINMYVNDAIGFKMRPEQPLRYSEFCFGTADAICIRKNTLRIHDLKTGKTKPSFKQLLVYAALFFLEYKEYKPGDMRIELRIYYDDDILVMNPEADDIVPIMDKIIKFDKILKKIKEDNNE